MTSSEGSRYTASFSIDPSFRQTDQTLAELFFPSYFDTGQNKRVCPNGQNLPGQRFRCLQAAQALFVFGALQFRHRTCESSMSIWMLFESKHASITVVYSVDVS